MARKQDDVIVTVRDPKTGRFKATRPKRPRRDAKTGQFLPASGKKKGKKKKASKAAALRRSAKATKASDLRAVRAVRAAAVSLQERESKLSKRARKEMRAHGLTRVNPGFGDLEALKKSFSIENIIIGGLTAWGTHQVVQRGESFVQRYGGTLLAGSVTAGAYLLARTYAPKAAPAILAGGSVMTLGHFAHALLFRADGDTSASIFRAPAPAAPVAGLGEVSAEAFANYTSEAILANPSHYEEAESFANPSSMQVLKSTGSLSGSIFD